MLCLLDDSGIAAQEVIEPAVATRQEAAAMLVPSIDQLLRKTGWNKEELNVLAVGLGPGSFTGIRTGLVTARTLASALQLPLLGVSAFECYASLVELPAGVILSCGPATYFVAAYNTGANGNLVEAWPPAYLTMAELESRLHENRCWYACATSRANWSELNGASKLANLQALPAVDNLAVNVAQIAWHRLSLTMSELVASGEQSSLLERHHWSRIEPLYLRGPSMTIKR